MALRYSSIVDAIIDNEACFIGVYDLTRSEKQYVFVSNGCRRILGYSPEEVLAQGFELAAAMIHEEDMERLLQFNLEMNQEFRDLPFEQIRSKVFSCENRIRQKSGKVIWMRSHSQLLTKTDFGEPQLVFFVNTDVTREKELDLALIEKSKREIDLLEQNGKLEIEQERQKIEIMRLELEKLRLELDYKEKELLHYAMNLAAKNELMSSIKNAIRQIGNFSSEKIQNEINSSLNALYDTRSVEEEWESFQVQFNAINPDFSKKLLKAYPNITKSELSIISMLRLQMQPKDIARFKYVSVSNIRNHIGRIRRKLGLRRTQNISKYLAEF